MAPKRKTPPSPPPPPRGSTIAKLRLPTHPRDVPEYTAFWYRFRSHLPMMLAFEALLLLQHFSFRTLLGSRYLALKHSEYRSPLHAVAVMGSPLFMDITISAIKLLVAIFITHVPTSVQSRIPGLFYMLVCRLINLADGVYLCLLQIYHIRLIQDYNEYPWFDKNPAPQPLPDSPILAFLTASSPYIALGLVGLRVLLYCTSQCYAFFSKSVPANRWMEKIVIAEYTVKVLVFCNSLVMGTPFLTAGWKLTIPTAACALDVLYNLKVRKRGLNEWHALWLTTTIDVSESRLPTADTMIWFATGLRKAAEQLGNGATYH